MAKAPAPKHPFWNYEWYIFVMTSGSVERCIGTSLNEGEELLEVCDRHTRTFAVEKSGVLDRWQQDRRVTKAGEQRIKEAFHRISAAGS
jgi:hypothetical protein